MTEEKESWLTYVNLSDEYERRARFLPGALTFFFLLPTTPLLGELLNNWINMLIGGIGVGAIFCVGISHLASAAGNQFQKTIWPRWPYDSPTNSWLHPENNERSNQQKKQWYETLKRVTGLDIGSAIDEGSGNIEALINDTLTSARVKLRESKNTGLLNKHNVDYGFSRNFTGLRTLWLIFAEIGFIFSWIEYFYYGGELAWSLVSTGILLFALYLAFWLLPEYVKRKAERYSESFYGALKSFE